MARQPMRRIEAFYPPEQLQTASQGRRLGGWALDWLIVTVTLGVGWLIWFLIVAQRGQTPGKQMLGMYIMREDGSRAGGWYTMLREIVVKILLFGTVISVISGATNGVGGLLWIPAALWCTWDRERQCMSSLDSRGVAGCFVDVLQGCVAGEQRAVLPALMPCSTE